MKLDGYEMVCEFFGFGKPDPKPILNFASSWIEKNGNQIIKKYEQEFKGKYSFEHISESDLDEIGELVNKFGKSIAKNTNTSFGLHTHDGYVIGLYYDKSIKKYSYFSFWVADYDAHALDVAVIKISYGGESKLIGDMGLSQKF